MSADGCDLSQRTLGQGGEPRRAKDRGCWEGASEDRRSCSGVTRSDECRSYGQRGSDFPFNTGSGQAQKGATAQAADVEVSPGRQGQRNEVPSDTIQHPSQFPRDYSCHYYLILRNAG